MIKKYIRSARPEHYIKNLFVFAPIIFTGEIFDLTMLYQVLLTFASFCLVSSSVYYMNDIRDRKDDATHPEKKNRPIASGSISVQMATIISSILFVAAISIAFLLINPEAGLVICIYAIINFLYSFKLKAKILFDIIIIATGFILRIIVGGVAIGVPISDWLLLCVGVLALFLALAKRRAEYLMYSSENKEFSRKVLNLYSEKLLDYLIVITATLSIITYLLYSILNEAHEHLIFTTPFVIYGIFRYLYIIYNQNRGTHPEREMLHDKPLLLTILLWGISSIVIILYFQ